MGERGPLPKSASAPRLAVVEGDTGHRRPKPTAARILPPYAPAKPGGLDRTASAKWDELVAVLEPAGMLTRADGLTLELAVSHYAAARRAYRELAKAGAAVEDERNDRVSKHPAAQVFRDNSATYLEYAKQLGLSFASRARTPAPGDDGDDGGSPFD